MLRLCWMLTLLQIIADYLRIFLKKRGLNISKIDDYDLPRDYRGHGTHTSSIAAGSPVSRASHFNYAKGTATGIAPKTQRATYEVLFFTDTFNSAAKGTPASMDQAVADGVDIMSMRLGFSETRFDQNPIAVVDFAAMEKGIFVACSAGNGAIKKWSSMDHYSRAGTIDRGYAAGVMLFNLL